MATAKKGDTVVINYVVRTDDGAVVGGTENEGPQTLTLGQSQVFPQIEAALEGLSEGEDVSVTVDSANAFGERRDEMVIEIPRDNLPADQTPQAGMTLSAKQQDGSTVNLVITDVTEEKVTADGNHPLAGKDLHFGVTLVEIKDAA